MRKWCRSNDKSRETKNLIRVNRGSFDEIKNSKKIIESKRREMATKAAALERKINNGGSENL